MAQTDLLKRYLDAGVAFSQLTQQKAEEIVRDLVRSGEVQTADARKRVEELLERSRQNTEGVLALVRYEVQTQVAKLGLVPKAELDRVEQELRELRAERAAAATAPAPTAGPGPAAAKEPPAGTAATKAAATKTAARKTTKKMAPAKKAAAKMAAARKTTKKMAPAKKAAAKTAAAKTAAAKTAPAKKAAAGPAAETPA